MYVAVINKIGKKLVFWLGLSGFLSIVLLGVISFWWTPHDAFFIDESCRLVKPNRTYWLGSDMLGRDLLSRMMLATQTMLITSVLTTALALLVGVALAVCIYLGPKWLSFTGKIILDVIMIFPTILLVLVIITLWSNSFFILVSTLAIANLPRFTKITLNVLYEQDNKDYVILSCSIGSLISYRIYNHYFSALLAPLVQTIIISIISVILSETSLSFLGLGATPSYPSWGYALNEAKQYFMVYPYFMFAPLLFIFITIFSLNLINYAIVHNR